MVAGLIESLEFEQSLLESEAKCRITTKHGSCANGATWAYYWKCNFCQKTAGCLSCNECKEAIESGVTIDHEGYGTEHSIITLRWVVL